MDKVAEALNKDSSIQIFLEESCDDLCSACPHHMIKDGCRSNQKVKSLDQKVLETFNLKTNRQYPYQDLTDKIHRGLNQATFEKICSGCEWYKIGVCGRGIIKEK